MSLKSFLKLNYYLQLFKKYNRITDKEKESVCNLGGLYVIGTERHDSFRIDNQLRGRSGRQGAPGTSRFFISLDDNLLRIFGDTKIKEQLQKWTKLDSNIPLESTFLDKSITNAQKKVDQWINEHGVRYFNELTNMAILSEEVGEVARIIARKYGEQSSKKDDNTENLADELSDVLFVLICLANQTGIDLEKSFKLNLDKKTKRDKNRHKSNIKLQ